MKNFGDIGANQPKVFENGVIEIGNDASKLKRGVTKDFLLG